MNNHQTQLATALSASNYLVYSKVDALCDNAHELIESLKANPPLIYPKKESAKFSENVNKLINQK
jgi:UDP-N-acetylglucosamine transferase subunit ALG13